MVWIEWNGYYICFVTLSFWLDMKQGFLGKFLRDWILLLVDEYHFLGQLRQLQPVQNT